MDPIWWADRETTTPYRRTYLSSAQLALERRDSLMWNTPPEQIFPMVKPLDRSPWMKRPITATIFCSPQLPADTVLHYRVQTWDCYRKPRGALFGQFRTALQTADPLDITFAVVSCQM